MDIQSKKKWDFPSKTCGMACGYSQVPGIDFSEILHPF
jgi:hypothetical protein